GLLAEEDELHGKAQQLYLYVRADSVRKAALRKGDTEAALGAIVRRIEQSGLRQFNKSLLQRRFAFKLQLWRIAPNHAQNFLGIFGGSKFGLRIGNIAPLGSAKQDDTSPRLAKIRSHGLVHVFEYPDNADDGGRIDLFA